MHSYAPERAARPDTAQPWQKVATVEGPECTRRYHSLDISEKSFGGSVEITLVDGTVIRDESAVADAHFRNLDRVSWTSSTSWPLTAP
jgi:2-methylcitrate dehydratase